MVGMAVSSNEEAGSIYVYVVIITKFTDHNNNYARQVIPICNRSNGRGESLNVSSE